MVSPLLSLAAAAVALCSGATAQVLSGDFNVLTMNVAGLPSILQGNDIPGNKQTNSELIGSLFAKYKYDVINVQEDFAYHAYIYAKDNHPFRTATSGTVPIGSGLNTLSNFPFLDFSRTKWDVCSNDSGADCLTPKGFTFMRVQVTEGIFVDFYNLHADAGTSATDKPARAANLKQVANFIDTWSIGNAVIVLGDSNARYTRIDDKVTVFREQNGLRDAFVQLINGGAEIGSASTVCVNPSLVNNCETVDKVFWRGSRQLSLEATYFNYDSTKFLQADGSILSDHNPVTVNFTWAASPQLRQSGFWGGPHGQWFNDINSIPASPKASVLNFRGNARLDAVALTLRDGTTFSHGGNGGSLKSLTLGATEFWTAAELCSGQKSGRTRNFYIKATTSTGRTLEAGTRTGECKIMSPPAGWQIVGYLGQSGTEVDQLGFLYAPQ